MDASTRVEARLRLKRIAGQVHGIERMLENERTCGELIMQLNAARAALAKVSRLLVRDHLRESVAQIGGSNGKDRKLIEQLMQVFECCES